MIEGSDQRVCPHEGCAPQRLAALLLVAALLPAVVATWSQGPIARVQTALVEASRAPAAPETPSAFSIDPGVDRMAAGLPMQSSARCFFRAVESLHERCELHNTPPPARA